MTREVHEIPPAERPVRWSAILLHRWPLGLTGMTLAVYGGLIALMLFYARGGKPSDDLELDAGPTLRASAVLATVEPSAARFVDGGPAELVRYEFTTDRGMRLNGSCFASAGTFVQGLEPEVEYLPDLPHVNRLVGARISLLGDLVSPVLGFIVFPGVLLVLIWLRGVFELRQMMARGDVAAAEPIRIERVPWVVPMMLRADYRFRDHHARWCEGRHWVRARSPLGRRLAEVPGRLAVIHDRAHPERSRLVVPEDFGSGRRPWAEPQTARRA